MKNKILAQFLLSGLSVPLLSSAALSASTDNPLLQPSNLATAAFAIALDAPTQTFLGLDRVKAAYEGSVPGGKTYSSNQGSTAADGSSVATTWTFKFAAAPPTGSSAVTLDSYQSIQVHIITKDTKGSPTEDLTETVLPDAKNPKTDGELMYTKVTYSSTAGAITETGDLMIVGGKVTKTTTKTSQAAQVTQPLSSSNLNIYTELAAGFAFSGATPRTYSAVSAKDSAGNPITSNGNQVYTVMGSDPQSTIATSLSGLLSIAIPFNNHSYIKRYFPIINSWGFTLGSGFANSTSGTFSLAPFVGLSIFLGDKDSVALTAGASWVPTQRLMGLRQGQEILTDQISTSQSYTGASLFFGITYRIIGTGKGGAAGSTTPSVTPPSTPITAG